MSHSYVLQTLDDIEAKADEGIAGIFPDVQCGVQHGTAVRTEGLSVDIDWNKNLVRIHAVDVCEFCEKPVGLPYIMNAHVRRIHTMDKSIALDCQPGVIRPGDLIDGVVEGTGLIVEEPVSMVFGNWTWRFDSVSDEKWKEAQKITEPRIRDLHKKGITRYGSW